MRARFYYRYHRVSRIAYFPSLTTNMKFLSPLLFCFVMVLFIQKVEAEKIPQSFIDSIASQSDYFPLQVDFVNENGNNSAERIKKASLALLYGRLTYVAEFPTAATTFSINSRCKADSQNYFASYLAREDWALRSNLHLFVLFHG